jgi:hypothetical protein
MRKSTSLAVISFAGLGISALIACGGDAPPPATPTTTSAVTTPPPPVATTAPADTSAPVAAPPAAPTAIFHLDGFQTPESVLYDDGADRYLVSNINGDPGKADNNGYISDVSPDGKITTEKWIEGGAHVSVGKGPAVAVTLNAPKGTGIANGILYVADIDNVRMFDVKTGAPKGSVKVPGSTFLNDIVISADGNKVYVSDTGVKFSDKGPAPTGTDAIWVIEKGKAKALAKTKDLKGPNGLTLVGDQLWAVELSGNELYRLDAKGKMADVTKLPKGMLDGIVQLGDGSLLISSWEGSDIFKGAPNGEFKEAFANLKTPADIGFDKKRNRVLVPLFMGNAIEAWDASAPAPTANGATAAAPAAGAPATK